MACKICVSIFAFITGYGLFLNYERYGAGSVKRWCAKRYIRTFSGYFIVWLLTAIIKQLLGGQMTQLFLKDGGYNGLIYMILDFLGIAYFFKTPKMIGPAWYMSAVVVFILLIPLIYRWREELWFILALHIVFLRVIMAYNGSTVKSGFTEIYPFITPFLLGVMFARYRWMNYWVKIASWSRWTKAYKAVAEIWIVIFGYKLYMNTPWDTFWDYHFGLFPVMVILFCVEWLLIIPGLSEIFQFLGKHSMNIFLVHTTLREIFRDFIFLRGHFVVCLLTLFALSLLASVIIEVIKKAVKYRRLVELLEMRVDGYRSA